MSYIKLLSPAKVNLTLEILGLRQDGYHELRSIIQPVNLFDEVQIELEEGSGIDLDSNGLDIPKGSDNLAWKAADLFIKASGLESRVKIFIKKQIPQGAGLGGGSSNAGAVLVGLSRLTKALSEQELANIAPQLGADVSFFIRSQSAVMEGIGEKITTLREFPSFHYVIVCPNIHSSTQEVYQKWDELNNQKQIETISDEDFNKHIEDFNNKDVEPPLQNDLEPAAMALYPEIKAYKEILSSLGLKSVLMSGSGSCVFALFREEDEANEIYEYLKTSPTFRVFLAKTVKGWHKLI
ncbi:MAG: 4-(cytidine 5'-diphospho)-2-C-methyl-D-erythritol kinase [Thermodesulfobacteriota bacterium]